MNHEKNCIKLLCAVVAAGPLLLLSTEAVGATGQLLDQNKQPVRDAWVIATRHECRGFAHCNTFCVEVKVTKTDAQGRYVFSSGLRSLGAYILTAYRPTYLPGYRNKELFMEQEGSDSRFSKMDAVSGRITYLAKTASEMACFTAPQQQRERLIPVYKEMFREARSISRFPEHHRVARKICREMYWTQLRPSDPSPLPEVERKQQEQYLQGIEPTCNTPIDDNKERKIISAIEKRDPAPIRSAKQEGFDFNRLLDGRYPPIVIASQKGSAEIVAELAASGAKPDVVGEDGRTALDHMLSGFYGLPAHRLSVVRKLLEAGADSNRPDIWGYPPLIRISAGNPADVELFRLFLKHGARIGQPVSCKSYCSELGRTVLHFVRDPNLARIAIEHGADVNAKTNFGDTPLMFAQAPEVTKILLDNGASPNMANNGGWTPLMHAIQRAETFGQSEHKENYREIAEMLVKRGARLDARNQHGVDAFYYTKDETMKDRLRELAAQR